MSDDEGSQHKRVYARGFYDGLKAAGLEAGRVVFKEARMNAARYKQLEQGLTGIARKVFSFVPVKEAWSAGQINGELRRVTGANMDKRILDGCLASLVNTGLVQEPTRGMFMRVEAREKEKPMMTVVGQALTQAQEQAKKPEQKTEVVSVESSTLDKLAVIAARMAELGKAVQALSADIEMVAIEVAEQMTTSDAEITTLRQLKALLQGLK